MFGKNGWKKEMTVEELIARYCRQKNVPVELRGKVRELVDERCRRGERENMPKALSKLLGSESGTLKSLDATILKAIDDVLKKSRLKK